MSILLHLMLFQIPQRYRFSSKSQQVSIGGFILVVVLDTTKVQIFKQITTANDLAFKLDKLFQIPQRYRFSSKSQLVSIEKSTQMSCFRYHKGTDFQANHNMMLLNVNSTMVVLDTTKVQIFKQITTADCYKPTVSLLFQIPQRYRFSSKSQHALDFSCPECSCFRYHKGTDFQANHNRSRY